MNQLLRNACLLLMLTIVTSPMQQLFAQGREVSGTVTGADNKQPIAGATVSIKGTRTAVVTNAAGHYKITLPNANSVLVFSHTGYNQVEIKPADGSTLDVALQTDVKALNDVVVIGYQTIRRKDLLASVSSVSAKDLKDIPINSVAEALNGRLAGVTATTSEGSPDAQVRIRVRGGMSITGDNSPLYIIDGVQVENGLSTIAPQDIQSIDVLKDAAATAIYGARGANGIIVVTTKSGRIGRPVVTYNGFAGVKVLARKLDVMSPYDFVLYQSERSRGSSTDSTTFTNNFGHYFDTLSVYKYAKPIDWQDEVFNDGGFTSTHNLGLSGASKKINYNFGYTYNDDKAIVINSSYKRHQITFKADYKLLKNVKLGIGTRYTNQTVYGAGVSDEKGSSYNRLRNAVKYRPFLSTGMEIDDADPLADPNVGNGLNLVNPISLANAEYRKKNTEAFNANVNLTITLFKNLTFKTIASYDYNHLTDLQYSDTITPYSIITGAKKPIAGLDTITKRTYTNSNVLTWSVKDFHNKHDFDVLVGEETFELRTESHSNLYKGFPSFTTADQAFKNTTLGSPFTGYPKLSKSRYTGLSFFGRINYSFMDKYLFSMNTRLDGASKFAQGNKWGNFPATSIAWRVKKEKFMQNVNFINDLKFRFGYGTIGNNRIADYLFLTTFRNDGTYFYGLNNQAILAYFSSSLVNPDLKWESTLNRNYGMDLSMFRGRVDLSVDYYDNTSRDLLLNAPTASTYGYTSQLQNVGKTSNKGFEFQLNTVIMRKERGLNWNANFNIAFNKNKILALGKNQQYFYPAASWGVSGQPTDYIERIGDPVGAMWGLVTDGFYKVSDFDYNTATGVYTLKAGKVTDVGIIGPVQPGSIRFKDLNGDGIIDLNNDRTIIGNPTPKFTGGLNQQFTYRNWDLSLFVNFSYGNDVYNANKIEMTNGYSNNSNMLKIMQRRWKVVTATGQTAQYVNSSNQVVGIAPDQLEALNAYANIWAPLKSAGAFYPHSWAIEDGSFLRFNNLTIGYTFPVSKISGLKMTKLRLYFTANNFAIITNYTGYDPEVSVRTSPLTPALDYSAYPKSRSFIFGVNATF